MTLPTEIWELIFTYVQSENKFSSASDLLSCSRVCREFSHILEDTKCTWLFKNVLPCIFSELDRAGILHLRQVCKPWKCTVDHFLHHYDYYFSQRNTDRCRDTSLLKRSLAKEYHPLGDVEWLTRFSTVDKLKLFLDNQRLPNSNPFPGGSLILSYRSPLLDYNHYDITPQKIENAEQQFRHFCSLAQELFTRYGELVYYLNINEQNCIWSEFKCRLLSYLHHLPNLQRLHLDVFNMADNFGSNDMILKELEQEITVTTVPNLKCFEVVYGFYQIKELLSLSPFYFNLTRLQLSLIEGVCNDSLLTGFQEEYSPELPFLPHLTELELQLKLYTHQAFLSYLVSTTKQKLKKLTLHLYQEPHVRCKCRKGRNGFPVVHVRLDDILNYLVPLAGLHVLNIFWLDRPSRTKWIDKSSTLEPLQNLVSLKRLQLYGFAFRKCGILSCLPGSLEYLHLHCDIYNFSLVTVSSEVKLGHEYSFPTELDEGRDKYYNCALWEKLPKLQCISLRKIRRQYNYIDEDDFSDSQVYWRSTWEWKQRKLQERLERGRNKWYCLIL